MFKTIHQRIRRSPYQSILAIGIMLISFFVATVYFLSALTAQRILVSLEGRPQAIAFIKDEAKPEEIEALKTKVSGVAQIKDIKFLSKEDALGRYKDQNKQDPLLLELVTANILPASLEVSAVNAVDLEKIAGVMKENAIVADVAFPQTEIKNLVEWVKSIRLSGTILVSFLLLESLLVLLVIFALKIALRKEEIEIMRLIGATVWQIRRPFVVEGMLYGLIAGLFSWGVSYIFVIVYHINPLGQIPALAEFSVPFTVNLSNILIWGGLEVTVGILIGFFGSFLAVWRYLKN